MTTSQKPVVALLVSTTRHARVGRQLADALLESIRDEVAADFRLVDLAEVALPWLDEPRPPSAGDYQLESTRAWAREVSSWDAVVVLSAQYNGGYPAPLKNAVDTVYAEWRDKPTLIGTYGGHRSGGGSSAGQQLRTVFQVTRNRVVEPGFALELGGEDYGHDLHLVDARGIVERNRDTVLAAMEALTGTITQQEDPHHD
ncbi:NADPH-dependent FMN reductase [Kocuria sp.]|uniref:NADPH-dependent FMN reductase n=1 Tax=Kocuria sp. TaxID=1871328 RepID=UPI0026DBA405|nr:NAD(P)H-dependent oxidoreductase [Kocuria sp.]MDO4920016.1 NAD(P)H-dependent oxidoreductase [Kocuria sp.]